jgi:hypothetical protein
MNYVAERRIKKKSDDYDRHIARSVYYGTSIVSGLPFRSLCSGNRKHQLGMWRSIANNILIQEFLFSEREVARALFWKISVQTIIRQNIDWYNWDKQFYLRLSNQILEEAYTRISQHSGE